MSISLEIIGTIHHIADTQVISDKFSKREFVLYVEDEAYPQYSDHILLQLTQDKCDVIDAYGFRDKVKVQVNLQGREYERKDGTGKAYFNSLNAWKIEMIEKYGSIPEPPATPSPMPESTTATPQSGTTDDLPF